MSLRPCRALALALLLGATSASMGCAVEGDTPPSDTGHSGDAHRRKPPLPNVFISPAGEPFRAKPGEPYPVAVWFARANTRGDGKLTRAEFDADAMTFFRVLDENHDGILDGLEVGDYEQKVAPEILPHLDDLHAGEGMDAGLTFGDPNNSDSPRGDGRARRPGSSPQRPIAPRDVGVQGAGVYSLLNSPEPVSAADTSFDGRITAKEFKAAADRRFDALDKTGVGYLTLSMLPKTPVQQLIEKREKARRRQSRDTPR